MLDEPTSGLDPLMERVFNECVGEHTRRGATVLLSSYILSEVDRLADRITIISEGRVVESGLLGELRHLSRSRIVATVEGAVPDLSVIPGVHDVSVEGRQVACTVDADGLTPALAALTAPGVASLTCTPPSLEDLFLDAYRDRVGAQR